MKYRIEEEKHFDYSIFRIQCEHTTFWKKRKYWKYVVVEAFNYPTEFKTYDEALLILNRLKFGKKIIYHNAEK